jgi:hypothetical protein
MIVTLKTCYMQLLGLEARNTGKPFASQEALKDVNNTQASVTWLHVCMAAAAFD